MTAILAIESGDLDALVTFSENAANQPPSKIYVQAGDSLTLGFTICFVIRIRK